MKLRDNAGLRLDLETIAQDELGHRMGATMVYRILDAVDRALATPSPETGGAAVPVKLPRCGVCASRHGEQPCNELCPCWTPEEADPGPAPDPVKPPATCRRCSECTVQEHHWIDNFDAEGEGDPTHECKHCDALGDECETCGGEGGRTGDDGYDMGLCPSCKGDGVLARTPAAGTAPKGETP